MASRARLSYIAELSEIDWDFPDVPRRGSPTRAHWYPSRMLPHFAGTLVGHLSSPGDTVLDPFCGTGTVIAEAMRMGRRPVGIDLNPVARLITEARTTIIEPEKFKNYDSSLRSAVARNWMDASGRTVSAIDTPPDEIRDWFHPETLAELSTVQRSIREVGQLTLLGEAALSGALIRASGTYGDWRRVRDDLPPVNARYRPAMRLFFASLRAFFLLGLDISSAERHNRQRELHGGDALATLRELDDSVVDTLITAPPAPGGVDYFATQRLTFLWTGTGFEPYRSQDLGTWVSSLGKSLDEYVTYLTEIIQEARRVQRRGGRFALVLSRAPKKDYVQRVLDRLHTQAHVKVDAVLKRGPVSTGSRRCDTATAYIVVGRHPG